ncbi:MAG: helix-turn-helix domain-containing protein [Nannocystaceae bacterium]
MPLRADDDDAPTPTREAERLARKARRQEGRRRAVLRAAREVVVADGLGFTMDRVAAEADVSKPALYYYFRSKEALVTALAIEILRSEVEGVARAIVEAPGALEAIAALVRARVERYADDPDAFRILYLWAPVLGIDEASQLTEIVPLTEVVIHTLEQRLERERRRRPAPIAASVDARRLATITWTTAQGVLAAALGMGAAPTPYSIDELADEAIRTLLRAARSSATS